MKALLSNLTHPPSLETPENLQQRRRRTKSDSFDTRVLCLHYYSNALGLDFGDEGDVYRVDQIEEWGAADRKEVAGRHRGVEQMSDEQGSPDADADAAEAGEEILRDFRRGAGLAF